MPSSDSRAGRVFARASLVFALSLACRPAVAVAQPVVNPTVVHFTAPSNRDLTDPVGNPLLTGYDLHFFMRGAVEPFQSVSIGKPQPDWAGSIRIHLASLPALPARGIVAEVRVSAVGPEGALRSDASNPFVFSDVTAPVESGGVPIDRCSLVFSPVAARVPASEGSGVFAVDGPDDCLWVPSSRVDWIVITAATEHGSGWISYRVHANQSGATRSGSIAVGSQVIQLMQDSTSAESAMGCDIEISPGSIALGAPASDGVLTVSGAADCSWSATSSSDWLVITAATPTGPGWISYRVEGNSSETSRSAAISAGGKTIEIVQAGTVETMAADTGCALDVPDAPLILTPDAGMISVTVASPERCRWTATTASDWLSIDAATGLGPGWVSISYAPNEGPDPRGATVNVSGFGIQVVQQGLR